MDHQAIAQLLGNYGEFFGAIAVVATLIYLAVQIRQNTRQIEFDVRTSEVVAYQEMTRRIVDVRHALMTDQILSATLNKVMKDEEELTREERRSYSTYLLSMLSNADAAFFQYERGLLSRERIDSLIHPLLRHFRTHRRASQVWNGVKHEFVVSFRDFLDDKLFTAVKSENVIDA
jgi:hypothetical protein